jgi:hypothetical protein
MITIEQGDVRALEGVPRAVAERKLRQAQAERAQDAVVRDPPQGDDRLEARQAADRAGEIRPARGDFGRRRLILRGTQRTALTIAQSRNASPSSGRRSYSPCAKSKSSSVEYKRSPA